MFRWTSDGEGSGERLKVNFLITPFGPMVGDVAAARRFYEQLKTAGIDVELNSDRACDILHDHLTLPPTNLLKIRRARKAGAKIIIHAHSTHELLEKTSWIFDAIAPLSKAYMKYFYNQADLILAPTSWTGNVLARAGVRRPVEVLSNGVDVKRFAFDAAKRKAFRRAYGIPEDTGVVYCAGMFFFRKGIDTFAEVARRLPQYQFIWAGPKTNLYSPLGVRKLLRNMPGNMRYVGFVDDITALHSAGDVFFFPSWKETQGVVILEAAAAGHTSVVRDIPVYRDWLRHGENCLKANTTEDFVTQIEGALTDRRLAGRLSKGARELAKQNEIRQMTKRLIGIYEGVLSGKAA